jgi:ParB family chromosome partitioning protein
MLSVNPSELEVAANVRKDVQLTKEFVASVKQHGVLVPIIVTPGLAGYAVIDGQRRALAAVEAGLAEVPVVVVDQFAEEKDRIVTQVVVNDQRSGLGEADTVAAVQELALFGMSATAIAKNLGEPKKAIDLAIKVGGSAAASAAMREHQVSLEDAALFAEFEDYPEALADLTEKATVGYYLDHVAQQWRDERGLAELRVRLAEMDGVEVLEDQPDGDPMPLPRLFRDEARGESLTLADVEEFRGKGLCVYPSTGWVNGGRIYEPGYAIRGWREAGLHTYSWYEEKPKKPTTPDEIAAAKEERRVVRENTKAWKAATAVRLVFLQKILARRVMPKGWDLFVAQHLIHSNGLSAGEWDIVLALLQIEKGEDAYRSRQLAVGEFLVGAPQKAQAVALAFALADVEGGVDFDRHGWRQESIAKPHLSRLQGWGYGLSEVEAAVLG